MTTAHTSSGRPTSCWTASVPGATSTARVRATNRRRLKRAGGSGAGWATAYIDGCRAAAPQTT